jgi:hypothetical protein
MMEKEFEVMNGSYDFIFGVDVIPELYPEYSHFLLTEMFDRREQSLLTPPKLYSETQRQQMHVWLKELNQMKHVNQEDHRKKTDEEEEIHICRIEIANDERDNDRPMPVFDEKSHPSKISCLVSYLLFVKIRLDQQIIRYKCRLKI